MQRGVTVITAIIVVALARAGLIARCIFAARYASAYNVRLAARVAGGAGAAIPNLPVTAVAVGCALSIWNAIVFATKQTLAALHDANV